MPETEMLKLRCPQCDARMKVPSSASGKRIKCPKCANVLRVPAAKPAQPSASENLDILSIAPPEDLPKSLPPSTIPQIVRSGRKRKCPTCGKEFPIEDKVCVECGVYLDTGRSILITQDENLDQIYVVAERTIWIISWIVWLGVYPIASEAFGLRKPLVVRGIAILTILTSIVFLVCMIADVPAVENLNQMMLWTGSSEDADQAQEWTDEEFRTDETAGQQQRQFPHPDHAAEEELTEYLDVTYQFHLYQLATHAFLHAGLLHLAGNMLFLMVLGARVNALIGNIWTLALYPLLAATAAIAQMIAVADEPPIPMLGASGAVMGLAGMYLVLFPVHKVHMIAWLRWGIPLPFWLAKKMFEIRGFWVVLAYITLDAAYIIFESEGDVAHWAHVGGFAGGVVIALILLLARLVDAQGGDLLSAILGRRARRLLGR